MKKIINGFQYHVIYTCTNLINGKTKNISQYQTQHITSKVKLTSLYDLHVIPSRH